MRPASTFGAGLVCLFLAACAPPGGSGSAQEGDSQEGDSQGSDSDTQGQGSSETSGGSASATTLPGSESDTDPSDTDPSESDTQDPTTGSFVPAWPDMGLDCATLSQCDPFAQDCPDGEKCGPRYIEACGYAIVSCIPITGDDALGEPCTAADGGDSCDEQGLCYPAALGFFDNPSICVSFCGGTADNSICPPDTLCAESSYYYDYELGCLPTCDPLVDACGVDENCTLTPIRYDGNDADFVCMVGPADVEVGAPCFANQACASGLCGPGELIEGCPDDFCCGELCDPLAPACPLGQACVELEQDAAVGLCTPA